MQSFISNNRWHNDAGDSVHTLTQLYGQPSAWLRRSAQTTEVAVLDDMGVQFKYMRAAAVFDRGASITALSREPKWTVVCRPSRKQFQVVLVSVAYPEDWIQQARAAGARAWWLCDPGPLFKYEPVVHADSSVADDDLDMAAQRGAGEYDRAALEADLARGTQTQSALANKYGITRSMVSQVNKARRRGMNPKLLRRRSPRTPELTPKQEAAVIQDIQAGTMTKLMIAERQGTTVNRVSMLINKYNLKGLLPRGGNAKLLSPKYRQNIED